MVSSRLSLRHPGPLRISSGGGIAFGDAASADTASPRNVAHDNHWLRGLGLEQYELPSPDEYRSRFDETQR